MAVTMHHSLDMSGWTQPMQAAARTLQGGLTEAHREIGELGVVTFRENIRASGGPEKWEPLSPATLISRARGRSGTARVYKKSGAFTARATRVMAAAKPLIFSSRLLQSMTYQAAALFVDIGSNLVYAAFQFFGSPPGHEPKVPGRSPFGVPQAFKDKVQAIYVRHIFERTGVIG